jgi:hypothetical protein
MKKRISIFAFLISGLLSNYSVIAQSGVYLTAQDYKNGKLSYADPCGKEHHIKLNEFLGKPYITVKHNDKVVKLMKDSIYAFVNCDGHAHRFYKHHDSDYIIEENMPLTIYAKETGMTQNKGFKVGFEFYFSTTLAGDIVQLTAENLKKAYPKNNKLHDAIDQYFPEGIGITDYDKFHNSFKVNHLLAGYFQ